MGGRYMKIYRRNYFFLLAQICSLKFKEKFWKKETFNSLENMRTKSTRFVDQHNALSAWKRRNKGLTQINSSKMLNNAVKINLSLLGKAKEQ
jgi:hypothetical protein